MKKFLVSALLLLMACQTATKKETPVSREKNRSPLLDSFPLLPKTNTHSAMVLGVFHFESATDGSDVKTGQKMNIMSAQNQRDLFITRRKT